MYFLVDNRMGKALLAAMQARLKAIYLEEWVSLLLLPKIGHVSALTIPQNGGFNCLMRLASFLFPFPFVDQREEGLEARQTYRWVAGSNQSRCGKDSVLIHSTRSTS